MEDYNLLDYNQHQLVKRAPSLLTGPNMFFLAPTKKGLRSPILKCKILLASISSHVPLYFDLCWSIYSPLFAHQYCCNTANSSRSAQYIVVSINLSCLLHFVTGLVLDDIIKEYVLTLHHHHQ